MLWIICISCSCHITVCKVLLLPNESKSASLLPEAAVLVFTHKVSDGT